MSKPKYQCPHCGSKFFSGHRIEHWVYMLNENAEPVDEGAVDDVDSWYGPFVCMEINCGKEFEELDELKIGD